MRKKKKSIAVFENLLSSEKTLPSYFQTTSSHLTSPNPIHVWGFQNTAFYNVN